MQGHKGGATQSMGRVEPDGPTAQNSPLCTTNPTPGEKSPVVGKVRGRPRKLAGPAPDVTSPVPEQSGPAVPAAHDAAPGVGMDPAELDSLRERQREDCRQLAEHVARVLELPDLGAGREKNQAAALGSITRLVSTLHEMERAAYGLGMDAAQGRDRVIVLPVPVDSMADWARLAAGVMGVPAATDVGQVGQAYGVRKVKE